jgi:glycosyltransferase involved in cell wall biosynthesis
MFQIKSSIKKFNDPQTICVITSYPDKKHGVRELNAVAWHAQKTLTELSKKQQVLVLAEHFGKHIQYKDSANIMVWRLWKRGNPLSLLSIFQAAFTFPNIKHYLIQFEFNSFGGLFSVLALPFILLILKCMGKKVHFEIHQVVLDIRKLAEHINIKNPIAQHVFNVALHGFYLFISTLADTLIVLEEELKNRLQTMTRPEKIHIVPISVDKKRNLPQQNAKHKLGYNSEDFVVLIFGFVNWYKGSDWIAKVASQYPDRRVKFILAGGDNPTLKDRPHYHMFYEAVMKCAARSPQLQMTGFVPDEDVSTYFSAADAVILPYRVYMSASGPFSLALSYGKPVLLSSALTDYNKSHDFADVMRYTDVSSEELFFPLHKSALYSRIKKLQDYHDYKVKLTQFSKELAKRRSSDRIIDRLLHALENPSSLALPRLSPAISS